MCLLKIWFYLFIFKEKFDIYNEQLLPGYASCVSLNIALKKSGYILTADILQSISLFCSRENNLMHFNDFMLIVLTLKSQTGNLKII